VFERTQPTTQAPNGAWFGDWQPVEPLATAGSVALWRVTSDGGGTALLRLYPRFQREASWKQFRSAAGRRSKVDHPRILPLAKLGTHGRPHLLLSDPVGEPLATRIEREPLSPEVALRVFTDVAEALDALGRAGLTPVDISPADVFLIAGDRGLVLADAGLLAQVTPARGGASRPTAASMSRSFASVLQAALAGPRTDDDGGATIAPEIRDLLDRATSGSRRRGRTPAQIVDGLAAVLAPEPVAAKAAKADPAPAALPAPPRRAVRPRRRTVLTIAACALAAAFAGAALGAATAPSSDPPAPKQLARDGIAVTAPDGWARASASTAPFDAGSDALVVRPARDPRVGMTATRSGDALLASARGVAAGAVALRGGDAWRYENVRIGNLTGDVYLLQTAAGPIVAACHAPAVAGRGPLTSCAGIVGSLRVRGTEALPLGGEPAVRGEVADALATLQRERTRTRQTLADASQSGAQAAAAIAVADAYGQATQAAGGPETVGPPGARTQLVERLAATGQAYIELATAANVGDTAAYEAARAQIAVRERKVAKAIAALSPATATD
jgi:hypothetical protein